MNDLEKEPRCLENGLNKNTEPKKLSRVRVKYINTNVDNIRNGIRMYFYISSCIISLFPHVSFYGNRITIFNLDLNEEQIKQKIMDKLKENSFFNKALIETNHAFRCRPNVFDKNFTLKDIAIKNVAGLLMEEVLKESFKEGIDYFNFIELSFLVDKNNELNPIFNKITFDTVIMLMDPEHVPRFIGRYLIKVKQQEIPRTLMQNLKKYCISSVDLVKQWCVIHPEI